MRPDTHAPHAPIRRAAASGVPIALAGSIAIMMSAAPAQAAEQTRPADHHTSPRIPAALDGSRTATVAKSPSVVRVQTVAVPETYTVQPGDTVWAIATGHGLRTEDVLALNGLTSSSVIQPGQLLHLAAAPAPPAAPVAPLPEAAPAAPPAGSYVVQGGDTISAIARLHGVSIEALLGANGLGWSSIIYPGQSIAIPGSASAASAAPVEPVAPPAAPVPAAGSYVVSAGDTISAIAVLHGVTVQAVFDANGLSGSSIIHPGQTIAIPAAVSPVLASNVAPLAPATSIELDAEQIGNAQIIIGVGRELGVPDRGIAIALGTAMQESWLRNLDWGDRDSLGLFQQRPSAGWGTEAEVSDAVRASHAFYAGASDPNGSVTRGLLDVDGWQNMAFADAAQAVQISAYPDRYAQWEQPAYTWLAAHG